MNVTKRPLAPAAPTASDQGEPFAVLDRGFGDPPQPFDTRAIALAPLDGLARWLADVGLAGAGSVVVCDATTHNVAGARVAQLLGGVPAITLDSPHPHADDVTADALDARLPRGTSRLVAVGAGTVNDLAKHAAHRRGIPYGVVPTAASMNGYTSTIAALSVQGVKRTLPATGPAWVYADPAVVASAPRPMAAAGAGDLLSKTTATADWAMSAIVAGTPFSTAPDELVAGAFARVLASAEGIARGEPEATRELTTALVLSGLSMAVAGSSAPSSGGEHLVSHVWDMTAKARRRPVALHGAQVAIATLVMTALYEALARVRPRRTSLPVAEDALAPYLHLYAGRQAELVMEEARHVLDPAAVADRQARLARDWDRALAAAGRYLMPLDELKDVFARAGVPRRLTDLGVIAPTELAEACHHARLVRDRYTVLDLAAEAGWLDELIPVAIDAAGVLG